MYCLSQFCFLCLNNDRNLVCITSCDNERITHRKKLLFLTEKIEFVMPLEETKICRLCCDILRVSYQFKKECLKKNRVLKGYVKKLTGSSAIIDYIDLTTDAKDKSPTPNVEKDCPTYESTESKPNQDNIALKINKILQNYTEEIKMVDINNSFKIFHVNERIVANNVAKNTLTTEKQNPPNDEIIEIDSNNEKTLEPDLNSNDVFKTVSFKQNEIETHVDQEIDKSSSDPKKSPNKVLKITKLNTKCNYEQQDCSSVETIKTIKTVPSKRGRKRKCVLPKEEKNPVIFTVKVGELIKEMVGNKCIKNTKVSKTTDICSDLSQTILPTEPQKNNIMSSVEIVNKLFKKKYDFDPNILKFGSSLPNTTQKSVPQHIQFEGQNIPEIESSLNKSVPLPTATQNSLSMNTNLENIHIPKTRSCILNTSVTLPIPIAKQNSLKVDTNIPKTGNATQNSYELDTNIEDLTFFKNKSASNCAREIFLNSCTAPTTAAQISLKSIETNFEDLNVPEVTRFVGIVSSVPKAVKTILSPEIDEIEKLSNKEVEACFPGYRTWNNRTKLKSVIVPISKSPRIDEIIEETTDIKNENVDTFGFEDTRSSFAFEEENVFSDEERKHYEQLRDSILRNCKIEDGEGIESIVFKTIEEQRRNLEESTTIAENLKSVTDTLINDKYGEISENPVETPNDFEAQKETTNSDNMQIYSVLSKLLQVRHPKYLTKNDYIQYPNINIWHPLLDHGYAQYEENRPPELKKPADKPVKTKKSTSESVKKKKSTSEPIKPEKFTSEPAKPKKYKFEPVKKIRKITDDTLNCKMCPKKFKTLEDLWTHIKSQHGIEDQKELRRRLRMQCKYQKVYNCEHCKIAYSRPWNLTRHLNKVHNYKLLEL